MKKHNVRTIRQNKIADRFSPLQMLTCYDFQTAELLNETDLDIILVGDSLGNVILGYETTIQVTLEEMIIFCSAVRRGATKKFIVGDLPFGSYSTLEDGLKNATKLFQKSQIEAIKFEGAYPWQLELIERLTQIGIPVMGHIGLTPQSIHQLGGHYTHGKTEHSANKLVEDAIALEKAGAFTIVLECVTPSVAEKITSILKIPTIGIGAGKNTDGQVLVINDLLKMGAMTPPKFCKPIANFYEEKKELINQYLLSQKKEADSEEIFIH